MKCLECNKEFPTLRSLHAHLKVHNGLEAYYHTFYPRIDRWDKTLIKFKGYDHYFSACFNKHANRQLFYKHRPAEEVRNIIIEEWKIHKDTKDLTFLPSDTYLMVTNICRINDIRNFFGSTKHFCDIMGLDQLYTKQAPKDFWKWCPEQEEMLVLVDTRERKPFIFTRSEKQKLSMGDYIATGKYFSKVAVDRKNANDFKMSFGTKIKRIRKNIETAQKLGYKLHFVVESNPYYMEKKTRTNRYDNTNYGYIYKNVRKILVDYPDTQIVFCSSRDQAYKMTKRILYFGDQLNNVDIQYFTNA